MTPLLIAVWVAAVTTANLLIAHFGPVAVIPVGFGLIGLLITTRDGLHEVWNGNGLRWKMGLLIATGAVVSFAINQDAARVALASVVAFAVAETVDALIYHGLIERHQLFKINSSNIVSATLDSVLFLWIAFGVSGLAFAPAQIAAKIAGGFIWSLVLSAGWKKVARAEA